VNHAVTDLPNIQPVAVTPVGGKNQTAWEICNSVNSSVREVEDIVGVRPGGKEKRS